MHRFTGPQSALAGFALLLFAPSAALALDAPAEINSDTSWTAADSPVLVNQDVTVGDGVTLSIGPGVVVLFAHDDAASDGRDPDRVEFNVMGRLLAVGTRDNPIELKAQDPPEGCVICRIRRDVWWGLRLHASGLAHEVDFVKLSRSRNGLMAEGNVSVTNSEIFDNHFHGLHSRGAVTLNGLRLANLVARCNRIHRNGRFGVLLEASGGYLMEDNWVYRNGTSGIVVNAARGVDDVAGVDRGDRPITANLSHNTIAHNGLDDRNPTGNDDMAGIAVTSLAGAFVTPDVTVNESIVAFNLEDGEGIGILNPLALNVRTSYNCVHGHREGGRNSNYHATSAGTGSICHRTIDDGPEFADIDADDFRLNPASPGRNAGPFNLDIGARFCPSDDLQAVSIEPAQPVIVAGGLERFEAVGTTTSGATQPDLHARWDGTGDGGTIRGDGLFTAGCSLGEFADAVSVNAGGLTTSVSPRIVAGDPVSLSVEPAMVTAPAGSTVTLQARARDVCLNPVQVDPTWSVQGDPAAGRFDTPGELTVSCDLGIYTDAVVAQTEGPGGETLEAMATVEVVSGAPDVVNIQPTMITLVRGETWRFTATVLDACGAALPVTPEWSVVGGGGTIDPASGEFTAGMTAGFFPGTIRAVVANPAGDVQAFADVTVLSARLSGIRIEPQRARVAVGRELQFEAIGISDTGDTVPLENVQIQWALVPETATGGTLDQSGRFRAGMQTGLSLDLMATAVGTEFSATAKVEIPIDFDEDGIDDLLEESLGLDPEDPTDRDGDLDGDGMSNAVEVGCGSDLMDKDSDDDGVPDGDEPMRCEDLDGDDLVSAMDPDSDNDGLNDGLELGVVEAGPDTDTSQGRFQPDQDPSTTTDPLSRDSDGDGFPDPTEDLNGNGRVDDGESDPNDMSCPMGQATGCVSEATCGGSPCVLNVCAMPCVEPTPTPEPPKKGGGGCQCATNENNAAAGPWLLLALGMAVLRVRRLRYLAVFALLAACATAGSRTAEADKSYELDSAATQAALNEVAQKVEASYAKGEQPIVMFDLDSTLYDNGPRTLAILQEFAQTPEGQPAAEAIAKLTLADIGWGADASLKTVGVTDEAVLKASVKHWVPRFFSDEYCKHDVPYPGAADYVNRLRKAGALIVYLTGRDTERMLLGSVKSLKDHGFPIGVVGSELIMKPDKKVDDADFKQTVVSWLKRSGRTIATFENEPKNANLLHKGLPEARHFFLLTNHSPGAPPVDSGVWKIQGYAK